MTEEMAITFTGEELKLIKCKIHDQDINPAFLNDSELPTDTHLIEYEIDGKLYVDAVRAYKQSDIFDPYYDKLSKVNGKVISITSGYGKIKPALYQIPKPKGN